jgi:hypothetical protein
LGRKRLISFLDAGHLFYKLQPVLLKILVMESASFFASVVSYEAQRCNFRVNKEYLVPLK